MGNCASQPALSGEVVRPSDPQQEESGRLVRPASDTAGVIVSGGSGNDIQALRFPAHAERTQEGKYTCAVPGSANPQLESTCTHVQALDASRRSGPVAPTEGAIQSHHETCEERKQEMSRASGGCHDCLAAFAIALTHGCDDGARWYTSTLQLQLASLEFCVACRSVTTLCVQVTIHTPRRLWRRAKGQRHDGGDYGGGYMSTRVPLFQPRAMRWSMEYNISPFYPNRLPKNLLRLTLGTDFDDNIDRVEWPVSLRQLRLGHRFNQSIRNVVWPASLRGLLFGSSFDQAIDDVVWPPLLQELGLTGKFNQPIEMVKWPVSLQRLSFGHDFNQPISNVIWPASLTRLRFGDCFDQPIAEAFLWSFNGQPADAVVWPPLLREVILCSRFNRPIDNVRWPDSVQWLEFRHFDQPIDSVVWPPSLERLGLGLHFNQPIDNVIWPDSLKRLDFGSAFNQPIDEVTWPRCLQRLKLASRFNQPIDETKWPDSLQRLEFGWQFDQPLHGVKWPSSLRRLTFATGLVHSIDGVEWPDRLERLVFRGCPKWAKLRRPPAMRDKPMRE